MNDQILSTIEQLKPNKASKTGTLNNSAIKISKEILVPHMGPLFRATFTLNYFPLLWLI
jgi:hypothetical protein